MDLIIASMLPYSIVQGEAFACLNFCLSTASTGSRAIFQLLIDSVSAETGHRVSAQFRLWTYTR